MEKVEKEREGERGSMKGGMRNVERKKGRLG